MKIIEKGNFKGRKIIIGKATYDELESLNIEKDFETALNVLAIMRNTRKRFFDVVEPTCVNRAKYGKRKAS
jgi:hypothetical protein